jgi:DNA polymerase I
MQILDIDYFLNTNKPVIRIFGKHENGTTCCVLYDKLMPYFYIKPKDVAEEKIMAALGAIKDIKEACVEEKFIPHGYQQEKTKVLKITMSNPQEVPVAREKIISSGIAENVFEADIMFKYRFMVDNGLWGMQWIEVDGIPEQKTVRSKSITFRANSIKPVDAVENAQLKYMAFDIECIPSDEKRPVDAKHDPIAMIAVSFSSEFRSTKSLVLVAKPFSGDDIKGFSSEKEMLEEFLNIIDGYDPDIMTGYNINSFDLPYITERLKQNKLSAKFGRCDKDVYSRTFGITQEFFVAGRVVVDPYQILKRDPWVKFHRYDLNTVAKKLLNEEKSGVAYTEMAGLWNGNRGDMLRFIEYARKDADLSLRILVEKGMMDKFFELSKISGVLLADVFGGQTRRVETMLMHEFKKRDFLMPAAPTRYALSSRVKERKEDELKGATVLEPKKGLHADGCVIVLDFKSLYPSLMITYNISPDSLLKTNHSNHKYHESPVNAKFIDQDIYTGIFPTVLARLLETRSNVKAIMKTKKGEEKRILNAKQLAIKDMSNSFYGYTGYVRARLYMIDVAGSITSYGRANLEKTKALVEKEFNVDVLYADTDSIFIKTNMTDLDEAKSFGKKISKYVTENLPGCLELQFEKIYRTFLILSKKRYAGWKFEQTPDGAWIDEIDMRGIETVRRDWCPLVTETMSDTLNIILKEGDVQKAIDNVKITIDKLKKGEIDLEKLTIIKGITQSPENYKGMLPHIELAKKLTKRNPYDAPKIGDRIGFVIVKGNDILSKRAEDPAFVKKNDIQLDSNYYIESQLFPPVERIFSSLGVEKSEVFGNGHQTSLSDLILGKKRVMKRDIGVKYDATKKEEKETVLGGWEGFACGSCNKTFSYPPIKGICDCGGEILVSYQGSVGKKVSID